MTLHILTPSSSEMHTAEAVFLPGAAGAFEVLPGHAPIISSLDAGLVRWRGEDGEKSLAIRGGMVQVKDDTIQICIEA